MRIDDITGWFVGDSYAKKWLLNNEGKLQIYLRRYHPDEHRHLEGEMFDRAPLLAMQAIQDSLLSSEEKWEKIMDDILNAEGLNIIVPGGKRKGKTATCWLICEKANEQGKPIYVAGPPQKMPSWAKRVTDPANAPTDCIIYITEAAIQYSARTAMSPHQRDALSILPSLAHSGRVILAETQHTRIIDVNLVRLADRFILKPEPLVGGERDPIAGFLRYIRPRTVKETLYFAGDWFTMITNQDLPKCWSSELSHAYRAITDESEAIGFAKDLWKLGYSLVDIRRALVARSFIRELHWWKEKLAPLIYEEYEPIEVRPLVPTKPSEVVAAVTEEPNLPNLLPNSSRKSFSTPVERSLIPRGKGCLPGEEP